MKRWGMGPTGGLMQTLLDNLEVGGKIRENLAIAYWPRVVGPTVAAASHAEEVRDGVLIVRTKGAAWSQELSLLKGRILPELNRMIGRPVIKDIRFHIGLPSPEAPQEPQGPTEADLEAVTLTPEDLAALDAEMAALTAVPDRNLRATLQAIIERQHRVNRWRLEHGWRVCPGCDTLFNGDGERCTVCLARER
jgi:predicted nucleic acid-binding Zn ribbon protein